MAITESRIKAIEDRLDELTQNFIQTQKNQVPITQKTDDTANKVAEITPYKETLTAYYGQKAITFYDVPEGATSVFFGNYQGDYSITRVAERLIVSFNELDRETSITIIVQ